jgi:hypothetical protein
MIEEFRYIEEFNKKYSVSNEGKVINHLKNKFVPFNFDRYGYMRVSLNFKGKVVIRTIHRLVAQTFVKNINPEKFNTVHHKDANKLNNNDWNLEWCTNTYNSKERNYRLFGRTPMLKKQLRKCLKCKNELDLIDCIKGVT